MLLVELQIKNFAIFQEVTVTFTEGLNIISGESGAGKSVLLRALEIALGGKTPKTVLKPEVSEITLLADLRSEIRDLDEDLRDIIDANELTIIRRTFSDNARQSRITINDRNVTLATLKRIGSAIVTQSTQHESISLLSENNHLKLLDAFGSIDLSEYRAAFAQFQELRESLAEHDKRAAENLIKFNTLTALIEELESLELEPDIRAKLEGQIASITEARKRDEHFAEFSDALFRRSSNVFSELDTAIRALRKLGVADETIEAFETKVTELWDLAQSVHVDSEYDEFLLEELRERLSEVARLERKYQSSNLFALLQNARESLAALELISLDDLKKKLAASEAQVKALAGKISVKRQESAKALAAGMSAELGDVGILGTEFIVSLSKVILSNSGGDKVAFMLRRKGQDSALANIVSGGELSRILLLFKKLIVAQQALVFDEIDTGISGSVARKVGEKLKELSRTTQVISISHLPQVASLADNHILVAATEPRAQTLNLPERRREIARMISGHEISEAGLATARELLGG